MAYKHLTQEERYHIYALSKAGHSQSFISKKLNPCKSKTPRELRRNKGKRGYRPKQANLLAITHKESNSRHIDVKDWFFICDRLHEQWSPEQIAHFVPISTSTNSIST